MVTRNRIELLALGTPLVLALIILVVMVVNPPAVIQPERSSSAIALSPQKINPDGQSNVPIPTFTSFPSTATTTAIPSQTLLPPRLSTPGRLLFVSDLEGYPAIYSINSDGSGLAKIFDDLYGIAGAAWSPDGSRIAFSAISRDPGHEDIFVIQADGSGLVNLTKSPQEAGLSSPVWSPDGTQLAYLVWGAYQQDPGLVVVDVDGSNPRYAATHTSKEHWSDPAWSPDGNQFLMNVDSDGLKIFSFHSDGSHFVPLTGNSLYTRQPAWSPDGSRIAFAADLDREGITDIYVMNADGSGLVNLTKSPQIDASPAWSPDGKKIAFVTYDGKGHSTLQVMDIYGSVKTLLFELPVPISSLDWGVSPDLSLTPTPVGSLTPTTTSVPALPDDWWRARQALVDYFTALHSGDYDRAVQLYGGSYLSLLNDYPIHDPHDHAGLFAWGCESLLHRCLLLKTIQPKDQSTDTYRFTVEFQNDDGSLFLLGPCCGGEGDPQSQFIYTVTRTREGKFLVMDLPVYVP